MFQQIPPNGAQDVMLIGNSNINNISLMFGSQYDERLAGLMSSFEDMQKNKLGRMEILIDPVIIQNNKIKVES